MGRGNGDASMGLSLEETGRHGKAREKLWIFAIYIQQAKKRVDNLATLIFSRTQLVRPTVLVISANEV